MLKSTIINTYQKIGQMRVLLFAGLFAVIGVTLLILSNAQTQIAVACPTDPGAPVTSYHGWRESTQSNHAGLDIGVDFRPIYAAESGRIIYAGANDGKYYGYQRTIDLEGESGRVYRYAHLGGIDVGEGQRVTAGQKIGTSGDGDGVMSAHLHWEIRTDGGGTGIGGTINPLWAYENCGGSAPAPPSGGNPSSGEDCHAQTLRRGSLGGCVTHLQEHLNGFGHGLSTDGDFGPATENAVRSFQSGRGLGSDGVVGAGTWNALHGAAPAPGASDRLSSGTIDSLSCNEISGWAYDPDKSDVSQQVHIYMDGPAGQGTFTADITANVSRPDVNNAFGITGNHGFQWAVPQQFRDGRAHSAYLYAIGLDSAGNKNDVNPQITAYSFNSNGSFGPCQAPAAPAPAPTTTAPTPAPTPAPAPARANGGGLITTVQNSQLCLDVPNISTDNGTRVMLYTCNGGANQQWIYNAATGTIRVYDNKCLDVAGFNTGNNAEVTIYDCHGAANQQWRLYGANSIQSANGDKCLDLPGNSTQLGTLLQMYDCNGTSAQQWNGGPVRSVPLAPAPTTVAPTPAPTPVAPAPTPTPVAPAPSGTVAITGQASERCLDIPGSSRTYGVYTQLWDCNGTEAQRWTQTGSAIKIYAGSTGEMCLDVNAGSLNNGAAVIAWPCHGGLNQQWYREGGTIRSSASKKCLDAYAGGTANETRIIMWTCHGGGNQIWR